MAVAKEEAARAEADLVEARREIEVSKDFGSPGIPVS